MANGPNHPSEQLLKKRSRGTATAASNGAGKTGSNGTAKGARGATLNRTEMVGPYEQDKERAVVFGSGPIGPYEQAAFTVSADEADPPSTQYPPSSPKSRSRNGASQPETGAKRLRFNASLQARLAKDTDFTVCVFAPDRTRGPVVIESIHIGVYRKSQAVFNGDLPVRTDLKINPGTKKSLPFTDAQKKELRSILKSKAFAMVTAVFTAPAGSEVTISIENQDDKKK